MQFCQEGRGQRAEGRRRTQDLLLILKTEEIRVVSGTVDIDGYVDWGLDDGTTHASLIELATTDKLIALIGLLDRLTPYI
jgi:hypothetical protein